MAYVSFFVIAAIAVGSALGLILRPNAIHGALFLVVNLGSVAALYLMLGAAGYRKRAGGVYCSASAGNGESVLPLR